MNGVWAPIVARCAASASCQPEKFEWPRYRTLPSATSSCSARDGLLDRGHRIRRMQLVQVDVVGAQPPKRLGHSPPDVGPAAFSPRGPPVAHVSALVTELGGQDDLV